MSGDRVRRGGKPPKSIQRAIAAFLATSALAAAGAFVYVKFGSVGSRAARLVAALSDQDVRLEEHGFALRPVVGGETAERLIRMGEQATAALLEGLRDPATALPAHLVLLEIWRPRFEDSGEEIIYDESGDEILGFGYEIFGLGVLAYKSDGYRPRIVPETMEGALRRWGEWLR